MEKHKRNENKILISILCVLFVLIVGLIIGIVVVDNTKKNDDESSQEGTSQNDNNNPGGNSGNSGNNNGAENGDGDEDGSEDVATVGTAEPMTGGSSDLPIDQEQEQIQKQVRKTAEMQNYVQNISRDDAMKYVDGQISSTDDSNDKFNIQLFKVNLYINAGNIEGALKVATEEIGDVSGLILWNQKSYYDVMARIYSYMDDQESVNKYRQLSQEIYDKLFDGGEGFYE